MKEVILNKYYNEIERKIISILYSNRNESFTSKEIYAKLLGVYSSQYVSVSVNNLECLEILKKKSSEVDKRNMLYQFSDEYEKLGKRIIKEEKENSEVKSINIDQIEGNVPQSERGKILVVLNAISRLSKTKKDITTDELKNELLKEGIEWNYEIENVLERLNKQGMIFHISPKIFQKV